MDINKLKELLRADRSIRRFDQRRPIAQETLAKIVELTRYCASGRNLQPLKYRLVTDSEEKERIFPLLAWAGYLKDWPGPEPGERPAAYIVQCLDNDITKNCLCDDGLQLQTITLGATTLGLGGCIIKSFNAPKIKEFLRLSDNLTPLYVLALGYPKETAVIDNLEDGGNIEYYRSDDGTHHVPKRPLTELIIGPTDF